MAFSTQQKGPEAIAELERLRRRAEGMVTLEDGPTITVDLSLPERFFKVTIEGNRILAFTGGSASTPMKQVLLKVIQGAGGNHTLTIDPASAKFGTDVTNITLSTTEGKHDYIGASYDEDAEKVDIIAGPAKGY